MSTVNLLYKREFKINDNISVMIPKVGDIIDSEDEYYNIVSIFTSMPIDMIAPLDEVGIDFSTINEWELFLLLFEQLKVVDTRLVLGGLDLKKFEIYVNTQNGNIVLRNEEDGVVIDRAIHDKIALILRTIHHLEKNNRRPGNEEAKEYMIKRAREKAARHKNRKRESQLEPLIVAMVNTEQYKYDFEGTRELSIYQFNESVRQVIKKTDYDNLMHGVYAGTINAKELSQDKFNWLTSKN